MTTENSLQPWPWETPAPGLYFGMTDDEYHSIKCLSATGIKDLQVSGMDFWARSWMNPYKEEDKGEEDSDAKIIGKAYHKRILEGREAFYAEYAPEFSLPDDVDPDDVLKTAEDLKEACHDRGLPVSGTKAVLTSRLLDYDPTLHIWDEMKREYDEDHKGMTQLSDRLIRKIELSAAMIENHPRLKYFFVGGVPEVTVIWDDVEFGVRFKARFDYLKIKAINDLKTFANQMKRSIDYAIFNEVKYRMYGVQTAVYLRGCEAGKDLARAGHVFGEPPSAEWLQAYIDSGEHEFNFCFQQKGVAPVARDAPLRKGYSLYTEGESFLHSGVNLFKQNYAINGSDPWVDLAEPTHLHF